MGFLDDTYNFLTDTGLRDIARELEQLADQANRLRQELAAAASSAHWSGAAADGFRARAKKREDEVAHLVGALDSAHSAVSAACALAGVF
jgi:uncharacterized protein YukE